MSCTVLQSAFISFLPSLARTITQDPAPPRAMYVWRDAVLLRLEESVLLSKALLMTTAQNAHQKEPLSGRGTQDMAPTSLYISRSGTDCG